jgi:GT2 family glycosyltransferase
LKPTIQSLSEQLYPKTEIIIACRDEAQAHAFEAQFSAFPGSNRIRWVVSDADQVTSAVILRLVADAKGELGLAARPGIRFSASGLYLIVAEWLSHPDAAFIYPDEDMVDAEGNRCFPFFKPDWSSELACSIDLAGPGTVFSLEKARAIGNVDRYVGEVWLWNLTLRLAHRFGPQAARHLPFVTVHSPTTARKNSVCTIDAKKMISNHLAALCADAQVEITANSHLKIRYSIPTPAPSVCAIVATRDNVDVLRRCVSGLLHQTDYHNLKVIIVDNDSTQSATHEYFRSLKHDCRVQILPYPGSFNFAAIQNSAVRTTDAELLALVNNDIEIIHPNWLGEMVSLALRAQIGVVGAKLIYPDERIQHAGVIMGLSGAADHIHRGLPRFASGQYGLLDLVQNVSAVTAACMVLRRSIYDQVGGMDESFAINFNDIDLCLRIGKEGYDIVWTPRAELYHWESLTRGRNQDGFGQELELLKSRWISCIEADPFYNPNLALETPYRELAFPPRIHPPWRNKLAG